MLRVFLFQVFDKVCSIKFIIQINLTVRSFREKIAHYGLESRRFHIVAVRPVAEFFVFDPGLHKTYSLFFSGAMQVTPAFLAFISNPRVSTLPLIGGKLSSV